MSSYCFWVLLHFTEIHAESMNSGHYSWWMFTMCFKIFICHKQEQPCSPTMEVCKEVMFQSHLSVKVVCLVTEVTSPAPGSGKNTLPNKTDGGSFIQRTSELVLSYSKFYIITFLLLTLFPNPNPNWSRCANLIKLCLKWVKTMEKHE